MVYFALYLLIGSITGIFAGLLGIGGGAIAIPLLVYAYKIQGFDPNLVMHLAAGTSITAMILTASSSLQGHLRHGVAIWPLYRRLFVGIIVGTITGAIVGRFIQGRMLEFIFAAFIAFVAVRLLLAIQSKPSRSLPTDLPLFFIAILIGAKSGLLGIGGGAITIPFLIYCNVSTRKSITTSAACSLTIAVVGSISFMLAGMHLPGLPKWSSGFVYWPGVLGVALASTVCAQIGANLSHKIATIKLRRVLGVVLLIMAIRMVIP